MSSNNKGLWTFICLFSFYVSLILADDHGVTFIYPTSGLILNYLDTVNVSYTSNFTKPLLYTNCKRASTGAMFTAQQEDVSPYNSTHLVLLDFQGVSSCQFDLRPNTSAGHGANSPFFAIVSESRAVLTTVGPSQTDSPPSTTSQPSDSNISTTPPPAGDKRITSALPRPTSIPASKPSHSGLSVGATIGIGVCAALAVIALAGIIFFIIYRRRQAARRDPAPDPDSNPIKQEPVPEPISKTRSSSSSAIPKNRSEFVKHGPSTRDSDLHELNATQTYELLAVHGVHELDTG